MVTTDIIEWVLDNVSKGKRVAIATIIGKDGSAPRDVGTTIAVSSDGQKKGTIGGGEIEDIVVKECLIALQIARPRRIKIALTQESEPKDSIKTHMICGGVVEVFIDIVNTVPRVLIIGAGHVGKPVGDMANILKYKVVILDDNPELVTAERFPYAERILGNIIESLDKIDLSNNYDAAVITHGKPELEYQILKKLIERRFPGHIWILCSRKKALWILEKLRKEGIDVGQFKNRVHAPAGLDIGSDSPEEIAISILAELICELKRCLKPINSLTLFST
ncbi:MAG: XdhC/CoxI family protein [Desulfurococcaceae archaeon]